MPVIATEQRVRLGRSELNVSPICYGTWQMSPDAWGDTDDDEMIASIRHACDHNINFFDTADVYGQGHAEKILGRAIQDIPRDQVVIVTKAFCRWDEHGELTTGTLARDHLIKACERSLRDLSLEYVDNFMCHAFDDMIDIADLVGTLEHLVKQGKIRTYGVSNWSAEKLRLGCAFGAFAICQPPYNLLRRAAEQDVLPVARANDMGVMVYGSLNKGLLTGKFNGDESFEDCRNKSPEFSGDRFKLICGRLNQVAEIARDYSLTTTQLVLAVTLMHPAIHCTIVGIKNRSQIEEAAGAMAATVSLEDAYRVRQLLAIPA